MGRGKDRNLVSFTGDAEGHIWRNGLILFGPDSRLDGVREWTEPAPERDGVNFQDALKFSGVRDFCLTAEGVVHGGTEDCIDINNRVHNLSVKCPDGLMPHGKYAVTIKGGSEGVRISGPLLAHGSEVDVDLGNHSDQSRKPSLGLVLEIEDRTGHGVRIRQLNAFEPLLQGGPYVKKFTLWGFLRPVFAGGYALLKKIGLPI